MAASAIPIAFVMPDLGAGGAQRVTLTLAGGLDPARFAVRLILVGRDETFIGELPKGIVVERLGADRLRDGLSPVIRILRRLRPALAFSPMGYLNLALLAAAPLLSGTRLIVREANALNATQSSLPGWIPGRFAYRMLYPRAAAIVAQTLQIAGEIARTVPGAADRLFILPNPVDEAGLRRRATPPVRPRGPTIVAAGRLTQQKGFDRLIDAMPLLPADVRLTIFGEGPDRAALEAQIARLGLADRVCLPGFEFALAGAIGGADVFALPSRWEGLPNVALEALALGTPVVATDEAGVDELAQRAGPQAMTIAAPGQAFAEALGARLAQRSACDGLRPSLLPAPYRQDTVLTEFQKLLERVAVSANDRAI